MDTDTYSDETAHNSAGQVLVTLGVRETKQEREVYFIQAVTLGFIKIGVADNAGVRLRSLRMGSPDRLRVIGVTRCNRRGKTEAELLERFKAHRSHGEWFHPALEILEFIDANAIDGREDRIIRLQKIVDEPDKPRGRKRREPYEIGAASSARHEWNRLKRAIMGRNVNPSELFPPLIPLELEDAPEPTPRPLCRGVLKANGAPCTRPAGDDDMDGYCKQHWMIARYGHA